MTNAHLLYLRLNDTDALYAGRGKKHNICTSVPLLVLYSDKLFSGRKDGGERSGYLVEPAWSTFYLMPLA